MEIGIQISDLRNRKEGRGCGAGRGPTNDDEGFSVSVDLKCFRKGPNNDDERIFASPDLKCFRERVWGQEGAH